MMNSSKALTLVAVFLGTAVAEAELIVEPDVFPLGTNISNLYTDVTLSAFGPNVESGVPSVFAVGNGIPSTELRDFGYSSGRGVGSNGFWSASEATFRADFSGLANSVTIDVIGLDILDTNVGELRAFDAANTLLGSVTTAPLGFGAVFPLSFASPDIAYVTATGLTGQGVSLDNMQWNPQTVAVPVPVPGAAVLAMLGLPMVGWMKRRFV